MINEVAELIARLKSCGSTQDRLDAIEMLSDQARRIERMKKQIQLYRKHVNAINEESADGDAI